MLRSLEEGQHVNAETAEYWDAESNAMVQLMSLVKELVTRPTYLPGENQKVDLSETRGETKKLGIGI